MITNHLIVITVSCLLTALITFFITTLSQRNVTKSIIKELIETHERIYHQKNTEDLIKSHKEECTNSIKEELKNLTLLLNEKLRIA